MRKIALFTILSLLLPHLAYARELEFFYECRFDELVDSKPTLIELQFFKYPDNNYASFYENMMPGMAAVYKTCNQICFIEVKSNNNSEITITSIFDNNEATPFLNATHSRHIYKDGNKSMQYTGICQKIRSIK